MSTQQPQRSCRSATASPVRQHHHNSLLTLGTARAALQALGFEHSDKVRESGTGRFPIRGKSSNNTGAAYCWTSDGQALHWYEFSTGDKGTIFADKLANYDRVAAAKRYRQAEEKQRQAEFEKQAAQDIAAKESQERWQAAATAGTHTYINRKGLASLHNAKLDSNADALLIPIYAPGKRLVNLQQIFADGMKLFMKGARVKGAYSVIGSLDGAQRVLVCEGWATGATLFELHGLPVVVAFNAGNLMPVCQALRSHFANIAVVIAGDDDRHNAVNVGRKKAVEAADAIGAELLFPKLCECCFCSDHNDRALCKRRCGRG